MVLRTARLCHGHCHHSLFLTSYLLTRCLFLRCRLCTLLPIWVAHGVYCPTFLAAKRSLYSQSNTHSTCSSSNLLCKITPPELHILNSMIDCLLETLRVQTKYIDGLGTIFIIALASRLLEVNRVSFSSVRKRTMEEIDSNSVNAHLRHVC